MYSATVQVKPLNLRIVAWELARVWNFFLFLYVHVLKRKGCGGKRPVIKEKRDFLTWKNFRRSLSSRDWGGGGSECAFSKFLNYFLGKCWAGDPDRDRVRQGPGRGGVWSGGLHAGGNQPGGLQHRKPIITIYRYFTGKLKTLFFLYQGIPKQIWWNLLTIFLSIFFISRPNLTNQKNMLFISNKFYRKTHTIFRRNPT